MEKKRVYIVRHGEAEGNAQKFSQTATTPLTERGEQQAETVAERFRTLPIDIVYASHMHRAQQTANHIAKIKMTDVQTIEYFHEFMRPSVVHNQPHTSEAYMTYLNEEQSRYADPSWRYQDGETFSDVLERVAAGVTFLEESSHEHIVLVSHGRLIRFLVAYVLHGKQLTAVTEQQLAGAMAATNTGITVLEYEQNTWKLITFNDLAHFAE